MLQCLISVILIELSLSLTAQSACIFINDCRVALEYIEKRRNEPDTIRILQKAHCGIDTKNGKTRYKVTCDQIPPFPSDCVRFLDCPAAVKLMENKRYDPEVIRLFQSSECGNRAERDMVLCNKIIEAIDRSRSSRVVTLKNLCGEQRINFEFQIWNGKIADLDDFNWIALLRYKNKTGHLNFQCHGSLISNKYVVTAAHCLNSNKKTLHSVVLGEYDIRTTRDCVYDKCAGPIQELSIESVRLHPNFQSKDALSDIALIRLNGTVKFTDFVRPICLPVNLEPLQQQEPLLIGGWGKIENRTMSNIKLKAKVYFLTKKDCVDRINYAPDNTMLCAGSDNGADTCNGDSGGPLMAQRVVNGKDKFFLAGIASFGGECGSRAAIYTDVAKFTEWIENNMED